MDERLTLRKAAEVVAELVEEKPHPNTVRRWADEGLAGIRLKTHFLASRRYTTRSDIEAFLRDVNEAKQAALADR